MSQRHSTSGPGLLPSVILWGLSYARTANSDGLRWLLPRAGALKQRIGIGSRSRDKRPTGCHDQLPCLLIAWGSVLSRLPPRRITFVGLLNRESVTSKQGMQLKHSLPDLPLLFLWDVTVPADGICRSACQSSPVFSVDATGTSHAGPPLSRGYIG